MISVYYNPVSEEEIEKTTVQIKGDDIEGLLKDIAIINDALINTIVVEKFEKDHREEVSTTFKKLLLTILQSREGTDIDGFAKAIGID